VGSAEAEIATFWPYFHVKDKEATADSTTGLKNSFGVRPRPSLALSAHCSNGLLKSYSWTYGKASPTALQIWRARTTVKINSRMRYSVFVAGAEAAARSSAVCDSCDHRSGAEGVVARVRSSGHRRATAANHVALSRRERGATRRMKSTTDRDARPAKNKRRERSEAKVRGACADGVTRRLLRSFLPSPVPLYLPPFPWPSMGRGKGYDHWKVVTGLRLENITPHVSWKEKQRGGSAIDERRTRHLGPRDQIAKAETRGGDFWIDGDHGVDEEAAASRTRTGGMHVHLCRSGLQRGAPEKIWWRTKPRRTWRHPMNLKAGDETQWGSMKSGDTWKRKKISRNQVFLVAG
jgi:hypothetical protein